MQTFHVMAYCNRSDTCGLSNNLQYKLYISRVNWSLMLRHTKPTNFNCQPKPGTLNSCLPLKPTLLAMLPRFAEPPQHKSIERRLLRIDMKFLKTYGLSIENWRYVIYCTVYMQCSANCDISKNQQSQFILSYLSCVHRLRILSCVTAPTTRLQALK